MAKTVDELIVEIKAETSGLRKGLGDVERRLKKTNKVAKSNIMNFGNLTKVFAAVGAVNLGRSIINTSRTFEDLGATLKSITGDTQRAGAALSVIEDFTAGTPFQLENVTKAFTKFYQAGITPSKENLTAFGNVAAANNKDITQLADAVFNATTGEMEMLKQFGIVAKQNGDQVTMTFEGQSKTIDNTRDSIAEYVAAIGQDRFAGALEERLNTVSGAFSNVADKASLFQKDIGEAGLNGALTELGLALGDAIELAGENGLAERLGSVLSAAVGFLGDMLTYVITNFGDFLDFMGRVGVAIQNTFSVHVPNALDNAAIGFQEFKITVIQIFNKLLRELAEKVNALIALYNSLPFLDDAEPVDFKISTQEATEKIDSLQADIEGRTAQLKVFVAPTTDTSGAEKPEKDEVDLADITPAAVEETSAAVMTMNEALVDMKSTLVESTHAFTQDFVKGLLDGQDALAGFKNFAKDMVSQIISTFLQLAVVNQILNSIFGLSGNSALPTIGSIGGKAGGGKMQAGVPMMVGERGPELFIPDTTGSMRNNQDSRGGGAPIVVNQNINFSTGVVPTVRAEVTKMLPQINDMTKAAVLEAAARGGSYRKGLLGT